ncbi:esterase-like activity of phytase family protein [Halomonas elongata]|uniref:Esterase-like activity of phytase family protein n=1 Tax=Halomonas elongata (strain ATCC 33173 / DSM 2581 / NBRC 15536 / NCIMB 2198 / 1H9) TaxID=768066 RepID=E1V6M7_HALED|nr:esterase-like activity of phytase family protein [Halomonas elongata]WBF18591.1 esterase-like activity of phytase family protein [Halomonas elongata]WPU47445.1 esterase-like activity of phytase family protein [Halomonas elongata DSM 2581]CBV41356.1 hydrolase domain protein [Halomonas elongata DSM 2581]
MLDNDSLTDTSLRIATYNASLNRSQQGELLSDLSTPDDPQAQQIASVIQQNRPDILLLNEFDYSPEAAQAFLDNYLNVSQAGDTPIDYPYVYSAPVNTGIASGMDLNGDGQVVTEPGTDGYADDALGFGQFPGQYGMLVLSRYPIIENDIRTFQQFPWADMPGARLPDDPSTPQPHDYYDAEALDTLPLSSKSHWDLPIDVNGEIVHLLASHPTPPTFDGAEDRNGLRNADEIRFWADYISPEKGDYIVDDDGQRGGLDGGQRFVIAGDQNVDPVDGDSLPGAAQQLLGNAHIAAGLAPDSDGGTVAAATQGGDNAGQQGDPRFDTADFSEPSPGNLRVDYVLPSQFGLTRLDGGIVWPTEGTPGSDATAASDHRLTYADLVITEDTTRVQDVEFIGETSFESGSMFQGTTLGGLSGLTYDAASDSYLAISDDRSDIDAARFYSLRIDIADGQLDDGSVRFTDVTTLRQEDGTPFAEGTIDAEAIDYAEDGTLFISSEGNANEGLAPSIGQFARDGQQLDSFEIPDTLVPTHSGESGIRNNLALESLTVTPDHQHLFTATENALVQDGPAADYDTGSPSRLIEYDLDDGDVSHEYLYPTEPVAERAATDDGFATNGLVDLLALDDDHLLAMERAFSEGAGNTIRLYEIDTSEATDISGIDALSETHETVRPVDKTLVADLGDFGIEPDNVEGMTLGPMLGDDRQSLLLVSDDNFSDSQATQFIGLTFDLSTADDEKDDHPGKGAHGDVPPFGHAFGHELKDLFDGGPNPWGPMPFSSATDESQAGPQPPFAKMPPALAGLADVQPELDSLIG